MLGLLGVDDLARGFGRLGGTLPFLHYVRAPPGGSFLYPPSVELKGTVISGPPVILFLVPTSMNELSLEHFNVFDRGGVGGKL